MLNTDNISYIVHAVLQAKQDTVADIKNGIIACLTITYKLII